MSTISRQFPSKLSPKQNGKVSLNEEEVVEKVDIILKEIERRENEKHCVYEQTEADLIFIPDIVIS